MSDDDDEGYFHSPLHALYAGWRTATLLDAGWPIQPIMLEGDHTAMFRFTADFGPFREGEILSWGPPPDGWNIRAAADAMAASGESKAADRLALEPWLRQIESTLAEEEADGP